MGRNKLYLCMLLFLLFNLVSLCPLTEAQEAGFSSAYEELMDRLENLTPGETIEVNMGTEKDQYDLDDPFEIRFQVSKESYIILMHISSKGDITFIAPSAQVPDNKVEAQRVYSTLQDFEMNIKIAPPTGVEIINIFSSTEKIDLFDADFTTEPFYTISKDNEERIKSLISRLDQLNDLEWSGTSVQILIGQKPVATSRAVSRKFGAIPPVGTTGTAGKFFPPVGTTGSAGKK